MSAVADARKRLAQATDPTRPRLLLLLDLAVETARLTRDEAMSVLDAFDRADRLATDTAAPIAVEGVETVEWGIDYHDGTGTGAASDEHCARVWVDYWNRNREDEAPFSLMRRTIWMSEWSPVEPETSEPEGGGS